MGRGTADRASSAKPGQYIPFEFSSVWASVSPLVTDNSVHSPADLNHIWSVGSAKKIEFASWTAKHKADIPFIFTLQEDLFLEKQKRKQSVQIRTKHIDLNCI